MWAPAPARGAPLLMPVGYWLTFDEVSEEELDELLSLLSRIVLSSIVFILLVLVLFGAVD